MKITVRAIAVLTSLALLLAGLAACSPASQSSSSSSSSGGTTTLSIATVNNGQMVQMEQLTKQVFEKDHPNIKVNFVTLPENDLRSKVTQDVATNAGKFDIATIGSYDTPIWAHNGWLQDLQPYFDKMSSQDKATYNYDDHPFCSGTQRSRSWYLWHCVAWSVWLGHEYGSSQYYH